MTADEPVSLLEFPCEFPIKAMGYSHEHFEGLVIGIVRRHAPNLTEGAVASRSSKGGKYTSITVTVRAESQAQLDAIYRELSGTPEVIMVL
jgi:putative lipoic acid-binding regulatory protein